MKSWTLLFVLVGLSLQCGIRSWAAEPKSKERAYSRGPLKIEEFLGEVPADSSSKANTSTSVRYEIEFAFSQLGQQVTVTVKSISLVAVFLPDNSWYGPDAAAELLDHEQGHFDIAEINARRAAVELEKDRRAGKSISATANTRQAAHKAVLKKLNELRQLVDQRIAQENTEYDRSTGHGLNYSVQSEVRKIQELTRASLVEELERLKPKRPTGPLRR